MRIRNAVRFAVCACCSGALLVGCGSPSTVTSPIAPSALTRSSSSNQRMFAYTGKEQSFRVPSGVTQLMIKADGASGPSQGGSGCYFTGGNGGVVKATIPVTPGEKLAIFVGGEGSGDTASCVAGYAGGFNGGGNGGDESECLNGTGGGGASDVRQGGDGLSDRVIVAGGGGGGAIATQVFYAGNGGNGGGRAAAKGTATFGGGYGGGGGTQRHGGKGGAAGDTTMSKSDGYAGKLGIGGAGGNGEFSGCGSGGGGGYYGGGGGGGADGASAAGGGGGGGGSSYIEPGATNTKNQRGAAAPGNGLIVLSW